MCRGQTKRSSIEQQGFTLVELLVAMAIAGVVFSAIFVTYKSQQDSYVAQEQVSDVQQNIRAALYAMGREIRMAGFNPTGDAAPAGIVSAAANTLNFTKDINDGLDSDADVTIDEADEPIVSDGDVDDDNEDVTYTVFVDADGISKLRRTDANLGNQIMAEYIDGVGFAYAYDNDLDGQWDTSGGNVVWAIDSNGDSLLDLDLDTNGDGVIDRFDDTDSNGTIEGAALPTLVPLNRIRAVKIWLLASTSRPDRNFTDASIYTVSRQVITPGGNTRRRLLTSTILCRNLGL